MIKTIKIITTFLFLIFGLTWANNTLAITTTHSQIIKPNTPKYCLQENTSSYRDFFKCLDALEPKTPEEKLIQYRIDACVNMDSTRGNPCISRLFSYYQYHKYDNICQNEKLVKGKKRTCLENYERYLQANSNHDKTALTKYTTEFALPKCKSEYEKSNEKGDTCLLNQLNTKWGVSTQYCEILKDNTLKEACKKETYLYNNGSSQYSLVDCPFITFDYYKQTCYKKTRKNLNNALSMLFFFLGIIILIITKKLIKNDKIKPALYAIGFSFVFSFLLILNFLTFKDVTGWEPKGSYSDGFSLALWLKYFVVFTLQNILIVTLLKTKRKIIIGFVVFYMIILALYVLGAWASLAG
jgi:hypothetical protein